MKQHYMWWGVALLCTLTLIWSIANVNAPDRLALRLPLPGRCIMWPGGLRFSADGKRVAMGGVFPGPGNVGSAVVVWDLESGQRFPLLKGAYRLLSFTPDGEHVVVESDHGDVEERLIATGEVLRAFRLDRRRYWAGDIVISGDTKWVAVRAPDAMAIEIWDRERKVRLKKVGPATDVRGFSPDRKKLLYELQSWGAGGGVYFVDVPTGKRLTTPVNASAFDFSHDGARAATSGWAMTELWDTSTWRPIASFPGPPGYCSALSFSPDGQLLARLQGKLEVLDVATHRPLMPVLRSRQYHLAAFSPTANVLAAVDAEHLDLWRVLPRGQLLLRSFLRGR